MPTDYNCSCDDGLETITLEQGRKYLMRRCGYAGVQVDNPPPGVADLMNSFLQDAQNLLYHRFRQLRLERWFTWNMTAGTRFYDLAANADECTKKLDPSRVRWVGVSQGDDTWQPLVSGINPQRYTSQLQGIPDSYEIRQCIEVWPAPADDAWSLRIKGDFGLLPFTEDEHTSTIDPQVIKLHALAYAKAHLKQPDAKGYMDALTVLIGDLTAGTHMPGRRYIPGSCVEPPATRPKVVT